MFLYETHLHTYPTSACAVNSPEEMVRYYKKCDYAGIIVTDHFFNGNSGCPPNLPWEKKIKYFAEGYERARREGKKHDLDVFFGLEYSYNGTDFLLYGLTVEFLMKKPGFDRLGLETLSQVVREAGGYIAQAHPFRTAFWIANPVPAAPHLIDGIEVHNASMSDKTNKKALDYAIKHNLAQQSGTDAHDMHMRRPSGIKLKKRAEDIFDIISALKSREIEIVR